MESFPKLHFSPAVRMSLLGESYSRKNSSAGGSRSGTRKRINKSMDKPEFSEKVKKLARRMLFKIKMYLMMNKAKKQVLTHLDNVNPAYSRLIRVLQNTFRSNATAEFILEYLKQLSFFANFIRDLGDVDEAAIVELCKCLRYEYIPAGSCVFQENDLSNDKFYVILKGSVSVVKKTDANVFAAENQKKNEGESSPKAIPYHLNTGNFKQLKTDKTKVNADTSIDESKQAEALAVGRINTLIESLGKKVAELHEGEGFGEKALLAKNSRRTASVITNTNCDFIILSKKDYMEIITKYDKRRQAKLKFMKNNIPYLNTITSSEIWTNLFGLIKEADYYKGTVIVAEGATGKSIYFIQDGYCDIEKTLMANNPRNTFQKPETTKIKKKLATFGAGSCLGEEILAGDDAKYGYTITVSSSIARLYFIEKAIFLQRFPKECIQTIREAFESKEVIHQQKIKKFSDELQTSTIDRLRETVSLQVESFGKSGNSSLRQSMAEHLRVVVAKERTPKEKKDSGSPYIRSSEHSPKPSEIPADLGRRNSKSKTYFSSEKALKTAGDQLAEPYSVAMSSYYESKFYTSDEVIDDGSISRDGRGSPNDNLPISLSSLSRRLEGVSSEMRKSGQRFVTLGNYDTPVEKKTVSTNDFCNPQLEKFDFGTTKSSKPKRLYSRQEMRSVGGNVTPTMLGQFHLYPNIVTRLQTPKSFAVIKDSSDYGIVGVKSARNTKLQGFFSQTNINSKQEDLITIRTLEGVHRSHDSTLKQTTLEDLDTKPKSQFSKFRTITGESHVRNASESTKESIKDLIKKAEESKKMQHKCTLKEKRKIHDSLNPKKQKEKFSIKTMKMVIPTYDGINEKGSNNSGERYNLVVETFH